MFESHGQTMAASHFSLVTRTIWNCAPRNPTSADCRKDGIVLTRIVQRSDTNHAEGECSTD